MSILILIQKDWHSKSALLKEFIEKSNLKKSQPTTKKFIDKDLSGSIVLL